MQMIHGANTRPEFNNLNAVGSADGRKEEQGRDSHERLSRLGIYTPDTLAESITRDAKQPYLIDELFRTPSVNLLVGDSGLGKTPLAVQIAVCIAAGIPVFGRSVQQGPVLYCDAESGKSDFNETLNAICSFVGLEHPPINFHVWSPHWHADVTPVDETHWAQDSRKLRQRVDAVKPVFVVVDAFRTFWPEAETKNQTAAETLASLRKHKNTVWLLIHHRRKTSQQVQPPDLVADPQAWFQDVAGSSAIVNQSDTRMGVEGQSNGGVDLLLAGMVRGKGPLSPMELGRVCEDGSPVGYKVMTGAELLNPVDRNHFDQLPPRSRFKDIKLLMGGNSDANVKRFIDRCIGLEIIAKDGIEYVKK